MPCMVVTLGSQRYEAQRPWPGPRFDFSAICEVTVLGDGRIAVVRRKAPQILVFTPAGELVDHWYFERLVCAHYVRASVEGGALITDLDGHQIIATDARGNELWTLGDPAHPSWMAPFNHPTCACLDPAGNLYVTDGYGNSCLHGFDPERRLRFTVGSQGTEPGQFSTPHSVIHLSGNRLLVADRENNRLQIFTTEGEPIQQIRDVFKPMATTKLPDGSVLVTDQTPRLSHFSPEGELIGRCRTFSTVAHGVSAASDGSIYLAEMAPDTLTRLVPLTA